jgi:hypothetical protein
LVQASACAVQLTFREIESENPGREVNGWHPAPSSHRACSRNGDLTISRASDFGSLARQQAFFTDRLPRASRHVRSHAGCDVVIWFGGNADDYAAGDSLVGPPFISPFPRARNSSGDCGGDLDPQAMLIALRSKVSFRIEGELPIDGP